MKSGVTLIEMLCGYRPFDGDSPLETMERIRETVPPALAELDEPMRQLVLRCLRKDPVQRFPEAGPLRAALLGLGESVAGPEGMAAWVTRALLVR